MEVSMVRTRSLPFTPDRSRAAALMLGALLAAAMMLAPSRAHTQADQQSGSSPNIAAACGPERPAGGAGAPLTVNVHDQFGPYRSEQVTMVSDSNGLPLVTLACDAGVTAFRVAPGSYRVESFVGDVRSQEVAVNVPPEGAGVNLMLVRSPNQPVNSPQVD
jgi:hypothetical protein